MNEHEYALMVAQRNTAREEYFIPRPDSETIAAILAFEAGFYRAWCMANDIASPDKDKIPTVAEMKKLLSGN